MKTVSMEPSPKEDNPPIINNFLMQREKLLQAGYREHRENHSRLKVFLLCSLFFIPTTVLLVILHQHLWHRTLFFYYPNFSDFLLPLCIVTVVMSIVSPLSFIVILALLNRTGKRYLYFAVSRTIGPYFHYGYPTTFKHYLQAQLYCAAIFGLGPLLLIFLSADPLFLMICALCLPTSLLSLCYLIPAMRHKDALLLHVPDSCDVALYIKAH
jgi:hypothetical protein